MSESDPVEMCVTASAVELFGKLFDMKVGANLDEDMIVALPQGEVCIFSSGETVTFSPKDGSPSSSFSLPYVEDAKTMLAKWQWGSISPFTNKG
jgi:hypothetical protein